MMSLAPPFTGTYFSGKLTAAISVHVQVEDDRWRLTNTTGEELGDFSAESVSVSDRLAHINRLVIFPDGSSLETSHNDALDLLTLHEQRQTSRFSRIVHLLESHSRFAAFATVLVVALVGVCYKYGLPKLAETVALNLPVEVEQQIGNTSLASFKAFGGNTNLDMAERSRAQLQLERVLLPGEDPPDLLLRNLGELPNAFALPGHHIVATDALLHLLSEDEIAAVMAHELGHLNQRHAEQQILLGSTSLLLIAATTGDLSILTSFAGALPLTLLQSGYSRDFERQADLLAVERLHQVGIPPQALAEALLKLEATFADGKPNAGQFSYLSTHPTNDERVQRIETASQELASPRAIGPPEPDVTLPEETAPAPASGDEP